MNNDKKRLGVGWCASIILGDRVIVNFGALLSEKIIQEIEEDYSCKVIERRLRLQIDRRKLIYPQVLRVVDRVDFTQLPQDAALNLPSDPIAAACLVTEFYARTGKHPIIIEFIKKKGKKTH